MRVIVTRPAREAAVWVQALHGRGWDAVALPLVGIEQRPPPQDQGPTSSWALGYQAWMFVSPNAVRGFYGKNFDLDEYQRPQEAIKNVANVRAWATGPGTRQALLELGWRPEQIDSPGAKAAQFDSKALWQLVQPQVRAGTRVLMLQGDDAAPASADRSIASGEPPVSGSAWLAHTLRAAGVQVGSLAVYRRSMPVFTQAQRALAQAAGTFDANNGPVWLFSSSEGVRNLQQQMPTQAWAAARALATHPRIAQAARLAGFGAVRVCKPTVEGVSAALVTS